MISLVLSGGVGSRLWPLSRQKFPKQFIELFENSLFEKTVQRLSQAGEVFVCTGEPMRALTETSIREKGLGVEQVFYEPMGRNTAPAIGLVCHWLVQNGRDNEVLGVFPSDHWIDDEKEFHGVLKLAQEVAKKKYIVTLGLKPHYPATGFGYIECLKDELAQQNSLTAFKVKGFREKPDLETAKSFIESGQFFWNSGMFIFQVSTMVQAMKDLMPDLWEGLSKIKSDLSNLSEVFPTLPAQSIDYGIMEKFQNQANIPCELGWSDLGSWDDVASVSQKRTLKSDAPVVELNSKNCFAFSDTRKTISFADVEDLIVVDTQDALMVTKKGHSQSVKQLYEKIAEKSKELTTDHVFERRPWGQYRNLWEEPAFKTKVITVDAKQQLSYQSHTQRSETWIVVSGQGEVVLDDKVIVVKPGTVVQIPVGSKHRMRNTSDSVLKFIEVQLGEYFGEDDITRYEDDYQRT